MSVITLSASGSSVAIRILGAALDAGLTPGHPITAARLVAMVNPAANTASKRGRH
ncbi:MAG: hypothetical protein M8364_02135 [Methylobacter sp.]|uniref:hypothetical protein n=1 Tax=Methylobacter sp. TaxID=2051955 RepID=UPI002588DEC7|nr:hypothetical protein [Methylobacter sp.]MCL7419692.1 hypothetical protein [Methylobacter sp.]